MPFTKDIDIDPTKSEWIRSKIPLDQVSLLGKDALTFFSSAHPLLVQTKFYNPKDHLS